MKNLLFSALAILSIWPCQSKPVTNGSPADFKIFKGTNIAYWLTGVCCALYGISVETPEADKIR